MEQIFYFSSYFKKSVDMAHTKQFISVAHEPMLVTGTSPSGQY